MNYFKTSHFYNLINYLEGSLFAVWLTWMSVAVIFNQRVENKLRSVTLGKNEFLVILTKCYFIV